MSASVLQERASDSGGATVSSIALAFSSNVTAGSTLHVGASSASNSSDTFTWSDTHSGSYTTLDTATDAPNTSILTHAYAPNVAGGATTVTGHVSTNIDFGIIIREIGGVSATPLDGHGKIGPGASPQTVAATNANQPALWSALGVQDTGAAYPTVSNGTAGINWYTYTHGGSSSSKRVTTAASQSEKFTDAGNTLLAVIAIFDEAGGGGASGSAAITEGADAVSATGLANTSGVAAIIEGSDGAAGTGNTSTAGLAAITEGADTVSATGVASTAGTAAITEGADVVAAAGVTGATGTAAITEGADSVTASGAASTTGTAAILEGADQVTATGTGGSATGIAAILEGGDIVLASGSGSILPAGKHRKRYGVRDGDRLLIFDTRRQADAAKAAIAARRSPISKPLSRIRIPPHEVIDLPAVKTLAAVEHREPQVTRLLQARDYTPLIALYRDMQRRKDLAAQEAIAQEALQAQEADEAAAILLLHHEQRRQYAAHIHALIPLLEYLKR